MNDLTDDEFKELKEEKMRLYMALYQIGFQVNSCRQCLLFSQLGVVNEKVILHLLRREKRLHFDKNDI